MLLPEHESGDGGFAAEFARGGDHLPGALADFSVGVLHDDENHAITLASLRSRSTSCEAAAGTSLPSRILLRRFFTWISALTNLSFGETLNWSSDSFRNSFFFAFMMLGSVG